MPVSDLDGTIELAHRGLEAFMNGSPDMHHAVFATGHNIFRREGAKIG